MNENSIKVRVVSGADFKASDGEVVITETEIRTGILTKENAEKVRIVGHLSNPQLQNLRRRLRKGKP